jgi:hypothetical protein
MNSTNAFLIRLLFVIASCLLTTSEAHFSSRGFGVGMEKRQQLHSSQLISQVKRHNTKKEEKTMTARKMETLKYVILYRFTSSSR